MDGTDENGEEQTGNLIKLIETYATEFMEENMPYYAPHDYVDAECKYVMWKLREEHDIHFKSIKDLMMFRKYGGV